MQKQRRVVIIPLSSPLFEEAVLFMRKNAEAEETSILYEAEKIALSCLNQMTEPPNLYQKKKCRKKHFLLFLALAFTAVTAIFTFFMLR